MKRSHFIFLAVLTIVPVMVAFKTELSKLYKPAEIRLLILDPGHFHAALLQQKMYSEIDSTVHVYAPESPDVKGYLGWIERYNSRKDNPTSWETKIYTGKDYFERFLQEKPGNVVILSGNNEKKGNYIIKSVEAGLNVLADKPMAISPQDFKTLEQAFTKAKDKKVLLYDIMTERFEITNIIQQEMMKSDEVFGTLEKGTLENPAVVKESIHHFYKTVSGTPLVRPIWFLDSKQAGSGLVDITTHFADLIQWTCFPEVTLNYKKDIKMLQAKQWSTNLSMDEVAQVTRVTSLPAFLQTNVKNGKLAVNSNGEMNYTIRGVHSRVAVIWNFKAPEGAGDTHYSIIRGTKANLVVRQTKEEKYLPTLYLEPVKDSDGYQKSLEKYSAQLQKTFPGIAFEKGTKGYRVVIPQSLKVGHESHFELVVKNFITYLRKGELPEWEVPNMLAKYYTTTSAVAKATGK